MSDQSNATNQGSLTVWLIAIGLIVTAIVTVIIFGLLSTGAIGAPRETAVPPTANAAQLRETATADQATRQALEGEIDTGAIFATGTRAVQLTATAAAGG